MKRSNIAIITLITFALSMFILLNQRNINQEQFLDAQKGSIAIPESHTMDTYRLQGEWEFHPNRFIQSSGIASHTYLASNQDWKSVFNSQYGFGSYVLTLTQLNPNTIYGLLLEKAGTSHAVYINDRLIMENGEVAKHALIYKPAAFTCKAAFVSDANGEARIVIEIANFEGVKGGLIQAPLFGTLKAIDDTYQINVMTEVFIFASMLTIAFVFLILHFIVHDVRALYMAMLSGLVATRIATTGTNLIHLVLPHIDFPLIWIIRLEYLSVFLMLPVMMLLLRTFSAFHYHEKMQRLLYLLLFLVPLIVSFSTEGMLSIFFIAFKVIMVVSGSYLIYLLALGYRNRKIHIVRSLAIGLLILIVSLLGTLFDDFNSISYLMLYGFVLFVGTTVMKRFSLMRTHNERMETTAKFDPLTGLLNRVYLNELIENKNWVKPLYKYNVIFLDMNNFKEINDEYGHEIGDQVLRISAKRLRNSCHESDMIFRFGGDEFIIIARLTEEANVNKMIKRIRDNFTEPIALHHVHLKISVAIGHETYDPDLDDLKSVISNSDQRMYEDKRKHKFE